MAKVQNNTIEITGTGTIITSPVRIISIQAIASGDNSEAVITDGDGVEIARFASAVTGHRTYAPVYLDRKRVVGIKCSTFTNMSKIIIHI